MKTSSGNKIRSLSAVTVVLVMLMTSISAVSWVTGGQTGKVAPMTTGSRAFPNDIAVLDVATPHDLDENLGSTVPDNAIPTGMTSAQADIKNVGTSSNAGAIGVNFNYDTGTSVVKWSDNMDGGVNGWTTKDLTANRIHWHYTNTNAHDNNALVSTYTSGPMSGTYGNWWEEVAEMSTCQNIPALPPAEPFVQFWNFTNTQANADGGYLQMQIGNGPWVDISPINLFPPPNLAYPGTINSGTNIMSNGKGAYTGTVPWNPTEKYPLWQQQKGLVNNTCVKFRFWFTSDGSNPSNPTGWFVDNFLLNKGDGSTWSDDFSNPASGNWIFKNMMVLGDTDSFQQMGGAGYNLSSNSPGTTAWWSGNKTLKTYLNGTDSVLESPSIALTGAINEARFTYWQKYNISTDGDGGWVEISTNGGTTWSQIQPIFDLKKADDNTKYPGYIDTNSEYGTAVGAFQGQAPWHKMAFDLTPYLTKTIKIRFHFWSNYDDKIGEGWFIDNAEVKAWNFVPKGSASATINGLAAGAKAIAAPNQQLNFNTEADYRLNVSVGSDDNNANNLVHWIIRVKNVTNFMITPSQTIISKTANHGALIKYWLNVTNIGNLKDNYTIALTGAPSNWNITLAPTSITNLRPGDPPFLVLVSVQTKPGDGPTTYPDTTKQFKDYPMNLTITSERVPSMFKWKTLTARITNTKPTASFLVENLQGKVYSPMPITADQLQSSDADKDALTFQWDWGDNSGLQNTTTWPVTHIYTKSKTAANPYVVKLKVSDGLTTSDLKNINVTVTNAYPTAKFVIMLPIAVNNTYAVGDKIYFNATAPGLSKDENPAGLTYSWDYGDGNNDKGAMVNHSYELGGEKTITLTVMDEEDLLATANLTIMINTPPVPVVTSPANSAEYFLGDDIEFNASSTTDNEQKTSELTFLWAIQTPYQEIGNQMRFTKAFTSKDDVGNFNIILTVDDHKAKGKKTTTFTIFIRSRPQHIPTLERDLDPAHNPVKPDGGFLSTSQFTYSVLYKDQDNDTPSFVRLVLDPGTSYNKSVDMIQTDPADKDYKSGVLFQVKVPGNGIGADGLHTFRFETADVRNITTIALSVSFTGPRITREKIVQNPAQAPFASGVIYANTIRYIGKQDAAPITFVLNPSGLPNPPTDSNNKAMLPVGLNVTMTFTLSSDMWDWANLYFRYSAGPLQSQIDKINVTSIALYKAEGSNWVKVGTAENSEDSMWETLNVTSKDVSGSVTYGLFGVAKQIVKPHKHHGTTDYLPYIIAAIVVVIVVVLVVVLFLMYKKKKSPTKKWGGKDGIDLKIDVLSGQGTDQTGVTPVGEAGAATEAQPMETTTGESVALYRPAAAQAPVVDADEGTEGGVAVYRPGVAAPHEGEEEGAPTPEAPPQEQTWTPPPEQAPPEEPPAETPQEQPQETPKPERKESSDDVLNEILGEEK
jgi:hypothetical protein